MKKIKLTGIKMEAIIFQTIEMYINELVKELAKKGIIELEEDDNNE